MSVNTHTSLPSHLCLGLCASLALAGCGVATSPYPADLLDEGEAAAIDVARFPARAADDQIEIHFTRPGIEPGGGEDPEADDAVVELIEQAADSVDLCLYEFSRSNIVDAAVEAAQRGVTLRFAGDGDEEEDEGYERLADAGVELALRRPRDRIMHNKFAVIDGRWVVTGSMNFSENGVGRNNNNLLRIDSVDLAAIYAAEFEQMYQARLFGRRKQPLAHELPVEVGGRDIDVFFSPEDDVTTHLREVLASADHSVYFMVFSFTDAGISQDLQTLHEAGVEVLGIFDESQARSRYSAVSRLAKAHVPVFIDGNDNRTGFAGGKLHHKVMIVDAGTESDPLVVSGSFNWSVGANRYNDENLVVLRGADFVAPFVEELCEMLEVATPHPRLERRPPDPCTTLLTPVRINEVMANPAGADGPNEYVELVNTGVAPIELGGWTLGDAQRADRHLFGEGTLAAGDAIVVWSGADPDGGARLAATSGALGLANNLDEVVLRTRFGVVADRVAYRRAKSGVAFNRDPDGGAAGPLVLHSDLGGDASPGQRANGRPWTVTAGTPNPIINELLPNPAGTDRGHELVEVVNAGGAAADLSGWRLGDVAQGDRHVFADETILEPGEAVVVVDGAAGAAGIPGAVVASSGALSLNNSDERVTLYDADGLAVDWAGYPSSPDGKSLNRATDGDPLAEFVPHDEVGGAVGDSSPGTRADGSAWEAPAVSPQVFINEVFPNPPGRDSGQEMVELVNAGDGTAQLEGWTLGDAVEPARHTFGAGAELAPGAALVVFDRGDHDAVANASLASSRSLSLNNRGDLVTLLDGSGTVVDSVVYQDAPDGVSLNRAADGDPTAGLVPHTDVEGAVGSSSPGARATGAAW